LQDFQEPLISDFGAKSLEFRRITSSLRDILKCPKRRAPMLMLSKEDKESIRMYTGLQTMFLRTGFSYQMFIQVRLILQDTSNTYSQGTLMQALIATHLS
jgi:hypothetical protein